MHHREINYLYFLLHRENKSQEKRTSYTPTTPSARDLQLYPYTLQDELHNLGRSVRNEMWTTLSNFKPVVTAEY